MCKLSPFPAQQAGLVLVMQEWGCISEQESLQAQHGEEPVSIAKVRLLQPSPQHQGTLEVAVYLQGVPWTVSGTHLHPY